MGDPARPGHFVRCLRRHLGRTVSAEHAFNAMIVVDRFSLFFTGLFAAAAFITVLISVNYIS